MLKTGILENGFARQMRLFYVAFAVLVSFCQVLAVEPVVWTNIVDATASGNTIEKTSGCSGCTAGGRSQQQIASGDGYIEFAAAAGIAGGAGFSNNLTNSTSGDELLYRIFYNAGTWTIRESGIYVTEGSYNVGDIFKIEVQNGQAKYYRSGILIHTSAIAPTYPLVADTFLYEIGHKVQNAMIETGQAQPQPTPPMLVSSRCSSYAAPSVPAPLRTFYLNADSGNDANDGLSPATAWKTLQQANNNAQPGDLFLLRGVFGILPGNTDGQWISPLVSGTSTAKITYKKEPGQVAIIETGRFEAAVSLVGISHVVVDGLEIRNVNIPFQATSGSSFNWFRNLYIHNSGGSTFRYGSHNNRLEDSVLTNIGSDQDNSGDSLSLLDDSDNNIVVRNYFGNAGHGAYDEVIQGASTGLMENNIFAQNIVDNQWSSNIILSGRSSGTLIECNEIKNATQSTGFNYPRMGVQLSGDNATVRYNIIRNNTGYGILMTGYIFGGQQQYPENNLIYNNTIVNNGRAGMVFHVFDAGDPANHGYLRNNTVENNIFWNNGGNDGGNGQFYDVYADFYGANDVWTPTFIDGNIFRHNNASNISFFVIVRNASGGGNLYYNSPALAQATFPTWTNNLRLDPLFVNAAAHNYALQAGSPLIDAGRIIPGVVYNGAAPDIGAIESGTSLPAPAAPSGLSATAVSTSQINLSWNDNSSDETGFRVERSTDNVNFSEIGTTAANISTFQSTGLSAATTYYYRVRAYNGGGNSAYSNTASATTQGSTPAAPSALSASAVHSTKIRLSWTDNSADETGFRIERSPNNVTFTEIATVAANIASYLDTGLSSSTTYYYRVRAYNAGGNSAYSNSANAVTLLAPTAYPGPGNPALPGTIQAENFNVGGQGAAYNEVFGATSSGAYRSSPVEGVDLLANASASNGFVVYEAGAGEWMEYTLNVSSAGLYDIGIRYSNGFAAGIGAFHVEVCDANAANCVNTGAQSSNPTGGWSNFQTKTAYNVNIASGTRVIKLVMDTNANEGCNCVVGNFDSIAFTASTAPAAPTNPVAVVNSTTSATMSWTDNSANETGFRVSRLTTTATTCPTTGYTLVTTTAANATSFQNTGLAANTTYCYEIRATNGVGNSSAITVRTRTAAPAIPASLSLTIVGTTQINLLWADSAFNETTYEVQRCISTNTAATTCTPYANVAGSPFAANTTTYSDLGLARPRKYFYRVRAVNGAGASGYRTNSIVLP